MKALPDPLLGRWSGIWWLVALIACGFVFSAQWAPPVGEFAFPLDDAWIHLQFAGRMAAGDGLAYNPGAWVTGSTAPLWSAMVALLTAMPGPVALWVQLLGIALLLLAADASGHLARALGLGPGMAWLARLMVALSYWLAWAALSGMEITLFAALSLWGLVLHTRARRLDDMAPDGLGTKRGNPHDLAAIALFSLAALARPEGYLLLALALLEQAVPSMRRPVAAHVAQLLERVLLAAIVLVPTLVFYRAIGGSWLPTTFAVKGSAPSGVFPDGRYLRVVADIFFRSQPILLLAAGAGAARLLARAGTRDGRGLLPAAWLFGLPLAYAFLTPADGPPAVGNFGRYYLPLIPVLVALGLMGLEPAARRLAGRATWIRALALVALLAPQVAGLVAGRPHYARTLANVLDSDVAAARWLAPRLDPAAVIAVQDIGALKYLLPNRVVDLAGIVTPDIIPALRGSGPNDPIYWEQRLLAFLAGPPLAGPPGAGPRPDYLVVFAGSYPMITSRAPGFERLQTFTVENNLAMAGDELVVMSTPWNRFPLRSSEALPTNRETVP